MSETDYLAMARKCGIRAQIGWTAHPAPGREILGNCCEHDELMAFAHTVAAQAVAAEREACAKVCDEQTVDPALHQNNDLIKMWGQAADFCAQAIRQRGAQQEGE